MPGLPAIVTLRLCRDRSLCIKLSGDVMVMHDLSTPPDEPLLIAANEKLKAFGIPFPIVPDGIIFPNNPMNNLCRKIHGGGTLHQWRDRFTPLM
jgi:hypothetical protein